MLNVTIYYDILIKYIYLYRFLRIVCRVVELGRDEELEWFVYENLIFDKMLLELNRKSMSGLR